MSGSPMLVGDVRWDVYLCHSTADKPAYAVPLVAELRRRGVEVWFDEDRIHPGDALHSSMDAGLLASRWFVLLLSRSTPTYWCTRELGAAMALDHLRSRILVVRCGLTQTEAHR